MLLGVDSLRGGLAEGNRISTNFTTPSEPPPPGYDLMGVIQNGDTTTAFCIRPQTVFVRLGAWQWHTIASLTATRSLGTGMLFAYPPKGLGSGRLPRRIHTPHNSQLTVASHPAIPGVCHELTVVPRALGSGRERCKGEPLGLSLPKPTHSTVPIPLPQHSPRLCCAPMRTYCVALIIGLGPASTLRWQCDFLSSAPGPRLRRGGGGLWRARGLFSA